MKFILLFLLFILVLVPVNAARTETVTLDVGDSAIIGDVNVSVIEYDKKEDKVLLCVNNQKAILSSDKRIGPVYFEIKSFKSDGVKLTLESDCETCVISDNADCFNDIEDADDINDEPDTEVDGTEDKPDEDLETDTEPEPEENYEGILKRFFSWIASWFS